MYVVTQKSANERIPEEESRPALNPGSGIFRRTGSSSGERGVPLSCRRWSDAGPRRTRSVRPTIRHTQKQEVGCDAVWDDFLKWDQLIWTGLFFLRESMIWSSSISGFSGVERDQGREKCSDLKNQKTRYVTGWHHVFISEQLQFVDHIFVQLVSKKKSRWVILSATLKTLMM